MKNGRLHESAVVCSNGCSFGRSKASLAPSAASACVFGLKRYLSDLSAVPISSVYSEAEENMYFFSIHSRKLEFNKFLSRMRLTSFETLGTFPSFLATLSHRGMLILADPSMSF